MSILLVDDSETMRLLIKRELRLAGWDDISDVADTGAAIESVTTRPVELVVADWNMPGGGGMGLMRELQRRGSTVKIGFVTCESSPRLRAEALHAGAQFLLTKPVSGPDLDWHVRAAMGMAAPAAAPSPGEGRSLAGVLSALFQRDVAVGAAAEPRVDLPRAVVHYSDPAGGPGAEAVVEMPLAIALGCALARVPSRQAREWSGAHTLTGTVEDAFMEVANVLTAFVCPPDRRHVLASVGYLGEARSQPGSTGTGGWQSSLEVTIDGFKAGRLAWRPALHG